MTRRACIVVLGDFGRSPRMQMHSLSLAKQGVAVDVVAYSESRPPDHISNHPLISIHPLVSAPDFERVSFQIIAWGLRVVWQTLSLLLTLACVSRPDFFLVQNPPSVPSLPVVWIMSRVRRCKFLIDWHNYGFTILQLHNPTRPNSLPVRIYQWFEFTFGSRADGHLCVTKALKRDLYRRMRIVSTVLYDRPGEQFKSINIQERHDLFVKLSKHYSSLKRDDSSTLFTQVSTHGLLMREDRPAVIISSTSWTEDEDFSMLLEGMQHYCEKASQSHPNIVCIVTGKGPLKEHYRRRINDLNLTRVTFILPWLESEDYPLVLAAGDIGVSLHTSSSQLDLPMKVLDMFGCGLPVCAYKYECLHELVSHEENGLLFTSGKELSFQILRLLKSFPRRSKELLKYRENIRNKFQSNRWHDNWMQNAWPVLQ